MDRIKIKEYVVRTLKQLVGAVPYAITGDYPEETKTTHVAVSIRGETPILGEMSSLLDRNEYTGQETRMYIHNVLIGITAYGPVDEETTSIIDGIRTAINQGRNRFLSQDLGITRIMGLSGVSSPAITEGGGRKTWATTISLNIQVAEIIDTALPEQQG
jgi:hypothetical protein